MNRKTLSLILFSPTGTTQTTLDAIANGTGCRVGGGIDLTHAASSKVPSFSNADIVLIGMPVYSGRLPALGVERIQSIQGNGALAVPVVVYGNRHYDDALVELYDLCKTQGFTPVAAGAFLGEHSFSTTELPLSAGRPDAADLQQAKMFGARVGALPGTASLGVDKLPGNRPYKVVKQPAGSATSVAATTCTQCNACIEVCPTHGMHMTETAAEADPDNCIWCMACERICPANARTLTHAGVRTSAQKLYDHFSARREPELFLA
jgi:NAD-dependent dihydropyrimidine dehydrogenase PreA subunit